MFTTGPAATAVVKRTTWYCLLDRRKLPTDHPLAPKNPNTRYRWMVYTLAPTKYFGEWECYTSKRAALAKISANPRTKEEFNATTQR